MSLGEPSRSLGVYGEVTEQMETGCSHSSAWQETRSIKCNLKKVRFRTEIRRNFFSAGITKQWAGCPERLYIFHPWIFSKMNWHKTLSDQV